MFATNLDNLYLELQSKSPVEKYRLYIALSELQTSLVAGSLDYFGLSKAATVPQFSITLHQYVTLDILMQIKRDAT